MANPVAVPGAVVPSGAYVSPGGPQGYQGQPGPVGVTGPGSSYYGSDTVNNQAYAVSVVGNFALIAGVILFIYVSNANTATNPTVNVNGLGAKYIIGLQGNNLTAGQVSGMFGIFWDNTYWRKFC